MSLRLFDTLTRKTRKLEASDGASFRFYCCGPTVYGPAHIGNFRAFVVEDILRRVLEVIGLNPYHVRNITDVDDKTIRDSQAAGCDLMEFTKTWTKRYQEDCARLNLRVPHVEPAATDHIPQQIALIQTLIGKRYAYQAPDGSVYFRVSSFPAYGDLSHLDPDTLKTQRVTSGGTVNLADEYERDAVADFALWKARKPSDGENFWPSPWGDGRPGWHIECSAMSMKYLGETFDLHAGGIDNCFPHHENEIAQSVGATGKPFSLHWMHCAFLTVEGEKMSKSLGNLYTLQDVEAKGFPPSVVRYALLSGHYRQQLNFAFHGLGAHRSAIGKLERAISRMLRSAGLEPDQFAGLAEVPFTGEWTNFAAAWEALTDDLNTPAALGEIFRVIRSVADADPDPESAKASLRELATIAYALGLEIYAGSDGSAPDAPPNVRKLAETRWDAKSAKDWDTADALRAEINAAGWEVEDNRDGYALIKRDR
jgi:cysteinyl-tRNA synthetase